MRGQPHQQPRKESLQRKYFTPNCGSDSWLFPPMNNVECFICHNFGHVAVRCRGRMVKDRHMEISSASRYFKGYCFSYNMFGDKAIDCYRRNMKHVRCYACNKFGHIAKECMRKFRPPYQREKTSSHSKIWEKGSSVRKMWHSRVYRHNRLRESWKYSTSKFQFSYVVIMRTSCVYTWVRSFKVAYMGFWGKSSGINSRKRGLIWFSQLSNICSVLMMIPVCW